MLHRCPGRVASGPVQPHSAPTGRSRRRRINAKPKAQDQREAEAQDQRETEARDQRGAGVLAFGAGLGVGTALGAVVGEVAADGELARAAGGAGAGS